MTLMLDNVLSFSLVSPIPASRAPLHLVAYFDLMR